jgi:hypothetical protein
MSNIKYQISNINFVLLPAMLLLVAMFGLALGVALDKSPTIDEQLHIGRGWAYLRTGYPIPHGHPVLTTELVGLGMLSEPGQPEPTALDGWSDANLQRLSDDLMWKRGIAVDRVLLLSRIPIIFLGLLMAAVIGRWAWELYGLRSAVLALALVAFSPTLLAHTSLATTDIGCAAFFVGTLYAWSRFLRRPSIDWLATSGVMLGLAVSAKFSAAAALIPGLGIITLWTAWRHRSLTLRGDSRLIRRYNALGAGRLGWLWTALAPLLAIGLISLLVLWACYRLASPLAVLDFYLADFRYYMEQTGTGQQAYLLGRFSDSGWWYYHPLVLLFKLSLPELLGLAAGVWLAISKGMGKSEWHFVFPVLLFLAAALASWLNLGIRHLTPIVPLLCLFAARLAARESERGRLRYAAAGLLVTGQIMVSLVSYPDYLAYFNLAAGGPNNGYRLLGDSNVDWGQDLRGLADYLNHRNAGPVYLSYFGYADPAYYGINSISLPAWPPPRVPAQDFYPLNPAPGLYAISANNLIGLHLANPDTFGYFRAREPVERIGHSIFIYEVAASTDIPPTWVGQCVVPAPLESPVVLRRLAGLPQLRSFTFDCQSSLAVQADPGWLLLPPDSRPIIELGPPDYLARWPDGSPRYQAWRISNAPAAHSATPVGSTPPSIASHLELLGYDVTPTEVVIGKTLTVWWRVRQPPPAPVSFFAHLITANGSVARASDTIGIKAEDWQPGMVLIQQHSFAIEENTAAGAYTLSVGLYPLATGEQFAASETEDREFDHVVLGIIWITQLGW